MGKKNKETNLGRALVKNRFKTTKNFRNNGDFYLHSTDIQDEHCNQRNFQSVTEENSFHEFLNAAQLSEAEFRAEKLNIKIIDTKKETPLLSKEKIEDNIKLQEKNKTFLKIPRRPQWNSLTTPQELEKNEKDEFLQWRKKLALLEETEGLLLTPYEKNLEFWRQLWRVIERSDVIVQIVDARNPLLFRCEDLEQYVKEISPNKINMILINKADFLTKQQRQIWMEYFSKKNVQIAFFSATLAAEEQEIINSDSNAINSLNESNHILDNDNLDQSRTHENVNHTLNEKVKDLEINASDDRAKNIDELKKNKDSSDILTRKSLIDLFKNIYPRQNNISKLTTIGLVGYPNVGKSSTINALLMNKKVSVSATPGKTKHFQTLYVDNDLQLCDCPGLVMPSFVSTKAEMILNGILPINQMRDHIAPMNLLGMLIPRYVLEDQYGIMLPQPSEEEDPDRPPTAEEILTAYGYNRGFMTQNGQPDNARSARYILKDFVNGKLIYCTAPPDYNQTQFHVFPLSKKKRSLNMHSMSNNTKSTTLPKSVAETTDKIFFENNFNNVHIKGKKNASLQVNSDSLTGITSTACTEKPWKKINKHHNKNKREKSRRVYAYLDKH